MDSYTQGVEAYKAASWDTAIQLFSSAVLVDPQHAEAYHARAMLYRKLGRVREALSDARVVVQLRPKSHKGYLEAARLCALSAKYERAELMFAEARSKVPASNASLLQAIETELEAMRALRARQESRPVMMLPTELFLEIIRLASEEHEARRLAYESPNSLRLNPIVTASHVCGAWRRSIKAAPTLWATLHIDGEQDRSRAVAKAKWWATHAVGSATSRSPSLGITDLIFTRAQTLGEHVLSELIKELQLLKAVLSLRGFFISWINGVGLASVEKHQIDRAFRFLIASTPTSLEKLTVHTSSQLRVGFSLPRFGNTFSSLRELEFHSAGTTAATSLWLPAAILPPYAGEEDWPATRIRRLALINAVWLIEFADATLGAPIVAPVDCPTLEELILCPSAPSMTWDLLSSPGLRILDVRSHTDMRTRPDPDLKRSAPSLQRLKLVHSPAFATRLFHVIATKSLSFPSLTHVDLRGASLTQPLLDTLSTAHAPALATLFLSSTSSSSAALRLASCENLTVLDVSATAWLSEAFLISLIDSAPKLARLSLDGCRIPNNALVSLVKAKTETIKELNLLSCSGVEDRVVQFLKGNLRRGGLKYKPQPSEEKVSWNKR